MRHVTIIAALDQCGGIGKDNALPWKISADMQHFKRTTFLKTVAMGRKTFESIGRVLPHRRNIVITRDKTWRHPGVVVFHSLEEMFEAIPNQEIFIIGGGEIYKEALPYCDHMILTNIHAQFDCDTFFPEINRGEWMWSTSSQHVDKEAGVRFAFDTYLRKTGGSGK